METQNKRDWGLIVTGVLLIVLGAVFMFAPVGTLVTITVIAGAFFLVGGIFAIINYIRFRKDQHSTGWAIVYGVLDILVGLMFLIHPLAMAAVIPWVIGIFVLVFAIYEIIAAFRVKKAGASFWGWVLFSGILSALLGILFFVYPTTFVYYIAFFLLVRGLTMIMYGWSAPSINWE